MIRRSELFLKQLVFVMDVLVLILAFLDAYHLRETFQAVYAWKLFPQSEVFRHMKSLDEVLWLLLPILPIWTGLLSFLGAYRDLRIKSFGEILWILLKAIPVALVLVGSLFYMLKIEYVNRSFLLMFFLLGFCFLGLERALLKLCFLLMLKRGYFHRKLVIVGTGPRAKTFIDTVRVHADWGLRMIGLLDMDAHLIGQQMHGLKVIGSLGDLGRILQEQVIDEVIFVVPRSWMARIEPALLQCELAGVRGTVAVDLFNMRIAKVQPTDLDGIPLVSFDTTPMVEWHLAMKRVLDVLAAGFGLLMLSPLFLGVALLIQATSLGPVFFLQVRCGLNGRRFTLFKFRSMVADAEARKADLLHLNELDGPAFKLTNDPRLTGVGRWLRKTSVDELPQLINVFKGEMSLVGPRPLPVKEIEKMEPWHRRRLSMRPGITGYWQVSGRSKIQDFDKWMKLDLEYIDRWSLKLDAKILLKTIPAVLFGMGAK